MKTVLLFLFCCLTCIQLFAYHSEFISSELESPEGGVQKESFNDSLHQVLKNAKQDTDRVNALNVLSKRLWQTADYDRAKNYADSALLLSEKLNYQKGQAESYQNIGTIYLYHEGNFSNALKNYYAALKIREEIGDKNGIADSYISIGTINYNQDNLPDALKNYLAALEIQEEIGNKLGMARAYNDIETVYKAQGNYPQALKNGFSALKIAEEMGNKYGIAICRNNIGNIYYEQRNYSEALKYQLTALKIGEEIGDKEGIQSNYLNIGAIYTKLKTFPEARKYTNDAYSLAKEIGSKDGIKKAYGNLAKIDSATGDYKQAFEHHKLYSLYKDSLFNEASSKQLNELNSKYQSEKKDNEITVLTKNKQIQEAETVKQRFLKNSFIAGLTFVLILVFFAYRTYSTRQKLKMQTLRNKIASDLHDEVGSTLSSIRIFSELARSQSKEVQPMLDQIGESSKSMLDSMADIVWTINPENDNFEKIILRMRSFAFELLGAKKIDFKFEADDAVNKLNLPMDVRKNLYMIFKEATNNMAKYAEADRASFYLKETNNNLSLMIRDNGKGFDMSQPTSGNGLKNMKKRAEEMGAQLLIESTPGSGTTIQLILKAA